MPDNIFESDVEAAALDWLEELGYSVLYGPDVAPDEPGSERESYNQPFLPQRLRNAIVTCPHWLYHSLC
jgi:type I restriction enzyme R subunit